MKINRFNESRIADIGLEYKHININNSVLSNITKFDIQKIHDSGLRLYTISNTFELVEQTSADYIKKLKWEMKSKIHRHFLHLLIITEEYSETIKKYLIILKDLEEAHDEEMRLRFKTIIGLSQRDVDINKEKTE